MPKSVTLNIALLTSFPLDLTIGSGVVRMIQGYATAFKQLGHRVKIFHPQFSASSYLNLAVRRLAFNRAIQTAVFSHFDLVLASDFDGFCLQHLPIPKIVLNAGILADIVRFEQGKTARILQHLAHRECQNVLSAQRVVTPSQYTAQKVVHHYGLSPQNVTAIPLGIDHQFWQQMSSRVPPASPKETTILCVARHYPRKGIADLLQAFARVIQHASHVRLVLVGGGSELPKNRARAKQLKLLNKVTFVGDLANQQQLASFYQQADIFCLPSYHETFGLVFLEAMMFGLPIVTYASTAIPEVVSADLGFLCEPGDIDSLAEKLLTLVNHRELRIQMGRQAQKYVRQFSWQRAARSLLQLYRTL